MISIQTNVDQFNRTLAQYMAYSKRTADEALVKQGTKVAFEWQSRLKGLMPAKGAITARVLAYADGGIKVRRSAREKAEQQWSKMRGAFRTLDKSRGWRRKTADGSTGYGRGKANIQALAVAQELKLREAGRGFSSFGASMRNRRIANKDEMSAWAPSAQSKTQSKKFYGRYSQWLSEINIRFERDASSARMQWGGLGKTELGESLVKPRQAAMLRDSIRAVTDDMLIYIRRKLSMANSAFFKS